MGVIVKFCMYEMALTGIIRKTVYVLSLIPPSTTHVCTDPSLHIYADSSRTLLEHLDISIHI